MVDAPDCSFSILIISKENGLCKVFFAVFGSCAKVREIYTKRLVYFNEVKFVKKTAAFFTAVFFVLKITFQPLP